MLLRHVIERDITRWVAVSLIALAIRGNNLIEPRQPLDI
jgi:hypothetical protein